MNRTTMRESGDEQGNDVASNMHHFVLDIIIHDNSILYSNEDEGRLCKNVAIMAKVYETPLVHQLTYRDEHGTPAQQDLANLGKLPTFIINLIAEAHESGRCNGSGSSMSTIKGDRASRVSHHRRPSFVLRAQQLGIIPVGAVLLFVNTFIAIMAIIGSGSFAPNRFRSWPLREALRRRKAVFSLPPQREQSALAQDMVRSLQLPGGETE